MSKFIKFAGALAALTFGLSPVILAGTTVSAADSANQSVSSTLPTVTPSNVVVDPENNLVSQTTSADGTHITLTYHVTAEQLAAIKKAYSVPSRLNSSKSAFGTMSVASASYTSTYNGSFKLGNILDTAGFIAGLASGSASTVIGIASTIVRAVGAGTVYFHYTQTSWSASDGFHVSVNIKFYKNASHTSYITQTTFDRVYQND
ncbi:MULTISPECIES: hypothetical protein [Lacticaseibacillus]|uniref:Uncharacterized protein n=2 Tax=Lacticaseibacillus TaxID=2759736 RepID=A0AAN1C6I2_LACCA|nr:MULTISPECIES: hypothetical protein [Lacticaseibacillus]ARY90667.1 hypothetical protein BGL52_02360 [Lacticaseibacillus casei]KAB1970522.1 hypothetical protein F9B82_03995 [Lacticaseibacillus casei]WLV81281.1 hypothetical protein LACSTY_000467 [Lacticaseibacillus sp. NCIMB 15473]WNX25241.1 hypothetical protein RWA15_02340 [Lacticaseibacillus casei]WNX28012.1 hypothetical protein RWA16_02340 [Lacticaseibacillus casei]